jgi:hypothetical protein
MPLQVVLSGKGIRAVRAGKFCLSATVYCLVTLKAILKRKPFFANVAFVRPCVQVLMSAFKGGESAFQCRSECISTNLESRRVSNVFSQYSQS